MIEHRYPNGTTVRTSAHCSWGFGADVMILQTMTGHPQSADTRETIELSIEDANKLVVELMQAIVAALELEEGYVKAMSASGDDGGVASVCKTDTVETQ